MARLAVLSVLSIVAALAGATNCDFEGGYAIRTPDDCEGDYSVDGGIGFTQRCCETGSFYIEGNAGGYCCPSKKDCFKDLSNVPRCQNPDWTLWGIQAKIDANNAWCCDSNSFGVIVKPNSDGSGGGAACTPLGETLGPNQATAYLAKNPDSTCTTSTTSQTQTTSQAATTTTTPADNGSGGGGGGGNDHGDDSSSLGSGAIAGIVVGSVLGVALIGGLAWWFLRRRSKAARASYAGAGEADSSAIHEMGETGEAKYAPVPVHELGGAESGNVRYELPAGDEHLQSPPGSTEPRSSVPASSPRS